MTLTVWGRRSSFNVQKVMWLIGELDLPHQHIDAVGAFGGLDAPAFLARDWRGARTSYFAVSTPASLPWLFWLPSGWAQINCWAIQEIRR